MASLRAFRQAGALLAGRAPAGALLPATAAARLSAGAPRLTLTAALHSFPASRDREEGPNPVAPHTRSLMPFSVSALRGMATSEVNIIGETSSGLPPTVHALKYPTSEIQYDEKMHPRFAPGGDESKRAFTYMVLTGGRFIYASAIRLVILKFLLSMSASKDVLALASLEVDLGAIEEGQTITVKWRGKPVFIRRRTEAEIADATAVEASSLRDPQTDEERAVKPEWLVLVGVCTHLGCVPLSNAGDYNGWFCPCHGSHYDVSGRIRKGPAPYNLEVPQYKFLSDDKLLVG